MMISLRSSPGVLLATEAAVRSRVETGSLWKTTTTDMRGRRRGYDRERHLRKSKRKMKKFFLLSLLSSLWVPVVLQRPVWRDKIRCH